MGKPSANDIFRRIYDEHHAEVFAYCLRRAAMEDAKDAAADVFLVAWRRLHDIPADRALPWLYGTARKVLANQRRGQTRLSNLTTRLRMNASTPAGTPETTVVRRERDREIVEALERLRETDREVIRLSLWEELPQTAIGVILGCSDRAVTMRRHRALQRLGRELHRPTSVLAPALAPETEANND